MAAPISTSTPSFQLYPPFLAKMFEKNDCHNHGKYITIPEFNKLAAEIFDLRLKWTNLTRKSDIANFVKKTDFDNQLRSVTSNKNELNELSKKR